MEARGSRYQICGPSAFSRYGFDEQIPNRIYAYNDRLSGPRKIGAVELILIQVSTARLGATEMVESSTGPSALYSSRTRSLVDAVYDWSRFNGIPRAYRWIQSELASGRVLADDLVALTLKFGNRGTIRRIGTLLERTSENERLLKKLERVLPSTKSPIPWIPSRTKQGPISKRWGVVLNDGV
jgi:predicted transcriptional regulator of viral defense system